MPADYQSAAAALSIPTSPSVTSPSSRRGSTPNSSIPSWALPNAAAARRLSTHRRLSTQRGPAAPAKGSWASRAVQLYIAYQNWAVDVFLSLSPLYRTLVLLAAAAALVLSILALVFSHKIFAILGPIAKTWRELPGGWVLLWLFTFTTAFPPMFGYSSSLTLAGFVFGFAAGWPIVASASVAGSLTAFLTSRGIFSGYVHRLVGEDKRFIALSHVLRRDGIGMLAMIRLCPLPYSLSNGFLSTIPSIRPWAFATATAMASPKLAVHVFIGSRLAALADEDAPMSAGDRALNYVFIAAGVTLSIVVGLVIYRRTRARAAELALEEAEENGEADGGSARGGEYEYNDTATESGRLIRGADMIDPDAAALAMDEDDISLWEAEGAGYRDSWDDEAPGQGK